MTTISLHLTASNYYTIFNIQNITLNDIYKYLIEYQNFTLNELKECVFISNGIMEMDKYYTDNSIMVNCLNDDIRKKFIDFMTPESSDTESEVSDNYIDEIEYNEKPVEYLTDPDFKTLIHLIKKNPHYLQLACTFISHGDVVMDIDNYVWTGEYNDLYDKIKDEYNNENLHNIICHFNGNENLIRRYMLMIEL